MIKVITTVGTSLIVPNFFRVCSQELKNSYLETIRTLSYAQRHLYPVEITLLEQNIFEWLKSEEGAMVSAEVHTLTLLYNYLKEPLHVILLATDTVASVLAAQFIRRYIKKLYPDWQVDFCPEVLRIKDLNINQPELFTDGIKNFMQLLYQHAATGSYLNISGGFKSMIPCSTLFAFENDLTLCYTHELAKNLILLRPQRSACQHNSCRDMTTFIEVI